MPIAVSVFHRSAESAIDGGGGKLNRIKFEDSARRVDEKVDEEDREREM